MIGERQELGVGLFVLVETASDLAGLVATEEKRLVFASFLVAGVEVVNNFAGLGENLGALNTRLIDRDFAVRAALVESEVNLFGFVVPVEGVLHFVAVMVVVAVGKDGRGINNNIMLAENLDHEGLFLR